MVACFATLFADLGDLLASLGSLVWAFVCDHPWFSLLFFGPYALYLFFGAIATIVTYSFGFLFAIGAALYYLGAFLFKFIGRFFGKNG